MAKKKSPFRAWLDNQPRKNLTHIKNGKNGSGWTVGDFAAEAQYRQCPVRTMTAYRWASGVKPRVMNCYALELAFPGIQF